MHTALNPAIKYFEISTKAKGMPGDIPSIYADTHLLTVGPLITNCLHNIDYMLKIKKVKGDSQ